jgi:hypothetical protein
MTSELDEPVVKRGSEGHVQVSDDVRHGGDPVQEFARLVTSGRRSQQRGPEMEKKSKSKGKSSGWMLPVMHPDAAGVDIGAEEILSQSLQSVTRIRCDRSGRLPGTCAK